MKLMRVTTGLLLSSLFFVSATTSSGCSGATPNTVDQSGPQIDVRSFGAQLDVRTPVAPSPVLGEGQIHLVYELHVTNFSSRVTTLTRVQAIEPERGTPLAAYEGRELADNIRIIGVTGDASNDLGVKLGAGMRAVVFMWISVEPGTEPPSITHRITVTQVAPEGETMHFEFDTEPQSLGPEPVVISAPVRGENWSILAFGPENHEGHRRGLTALGTRARIAARFATDWVQFIDGSGRIDDREGNSAHHAWGRPSPLPMGSSSR